MEPTTRKKGFVYSDTLSEEVLNDTYMAIPKPKKTRAEIYQAVQAWAYFQTDTLPPLTYNAAVRDELLELGRQNDILWEKAINLSEDASIRMYVELKSDLLALISGPLTEVEQAVKNATDIPVKAGQPKAGKYSDALTELLIIWRWATEKKTIGKHFGSFAELPLAAIFGDKLNGQPIEEHLRKIRAQLNMHPDRFHLHYLP